MKILISGGDGLLARHLIISRERNHLVTALTHREMNVGIYGEVLDAIATHQPDVFIHCAAMTVPTADHDQWPRSSINANIIGSAYPTMACHYTQGQTRLVYISTDFVYPGTVGPYSEDSPVLPVNNYAKSKLAGEMAAQMLPDSLILRCAFTERPFRHPRAFTDSIKSYLCVDEIAPLIWSIIESGYVGIVNVGGKARSIYDFAKESVPTVGKILRTEVGDWVPADTSMNLALMERILSRDPTLQYPARDSKS